MVTGVLPLALEDATKTIQAFLLTGKEYVYEACWPWRNSRDLRQVGAIRWLQACFL